MIDWPAILGSVQTASGRLTEDDRLERTRALVDATFAEPLSVEQLAKSACLSREHFIRAFSRAYGLTPHQYVTKKRVHEARRLLEASDLSVTDVCLEVGFSSLGSFSTMFKRHIGHSPDRYRRRIVACLPLARIVTVPACFAMKFGGTSSLFEKRAAGGLL